MFALVSTLLLGSIGFYLYQSLQREIAWRDDQALLGRLERMQALISDSDSIEQFMVRQRVFYPSTLYSQRTVVPKMFPEIGFRNASDECAGSLEKLRWHFYCRAVVKVRSH